MELLDEAYQDEEDKTPHYRLKLRNNLQLDKPSKKQMIKQNTISTKKNGVKLLYKYIGIHIPELDKIGGKTFNNNPSQELQYEDIIIKKKSKKQWKYQTLPFGH